MESVFSLQSFLRYLFISLLFILILLFKNSGEKTNLIVFCDVDQGDATYIRLENNFDIVIDAGPDQRVLDCLGKYMPFYDREIELAFLSHPDWDHYSGFIELLKRYKIDNFYLSPLDNKTKSYQMLKGLLYEKRVRFAPFTAGEKILLGNVSIWAVWPTNFFLEQNTFSDRKSDYFYQPKIDTNDFSQVFLLTIGKIKILFTGDISPLGEQKILKKSLPTVTILKVPHHGSKHNLIETFLQAIKPQIAVISVGKNNNYGHPSSEIIRMLEKYHLQIRRTDQEGDIVFRF